MRLTMRPAYRYAATALAALMLAGCGTGTPTPRPTSPSPSADIAVASPTTSPVATPTPPPPTPAPTPVATGSWPSGWDAAFCTAFEEVAVSQELAVDIGRALEEEQRDDAQLLARELEGTSVYATELLRGLPEWPPAQAVIGQMVQLMDIGERVGRNYRRFINQDRRPALRRARELSEDMRPIVEAIDGAMAELIRTEPLRCQRDFTLETP